MSYYFYPGVGPVLHIILARVHLQYYAFSAELPGFLKFLRAS